MAKENIQPLSGIVLNLPQPALPKAEDYLKAYNGYTYTAVSSIAQEVASIKLLLLKKVTVRGNTETEEIKEHPSISLLHFANEFITQYDLIELTQIYSELVGEAFWVIIRDNAGMPREILPLRPDWVKIVPDKQKVIKEYIYAPSGNTSEGVKIPPENMVPFKYFNPLNPFRGKGSVQAASMPIDIFDFAQQHNRNFFFNNATPGLIFTTDRKLDEKVIKRFVQQWASTFGGRENAHKVAFLGDNFKMEKASTTAKDMDFANQHKIMRDDILAVFKVPKTVLGLTEDVNRANAEATTRAFMERVITPRMKKFVNTLNEFYLPMFPDAENLFFDFEDPAPEDVEKKLQIYQSGLKFGWLTPNEVREMENLDPKDGGDDLSPASISVEDIKDKEDELDKIMDNIKTQEKKIITTAKTKADSIVKEGKVEAEKERKGILGSIEKLRDKAKEIIGGAVKRT